MNNTFVYVIRMLIIAAVAFFLGGCFYKKKNPVEIFEIKNITKFDFGYSVGYAMNNLCSYTINLKDGKYIASYKKNGIPEEERLSKEIPMEKVIELENKLKELNVEKWNGFDGNDKNVLDGNDFHLYITNDENKHFSAKGYEEWPENYGTIKGIIEIFFFDLFKDEIK